MVGWAPVLERHEPLAPEGPPASSSEPVAPIIRRHARGRGTGGVQTDAWVDSTGRVRQIPGALGTRSAEGWRDADETPSATAAAASRQRAPRRRYSVATARGRALGAAMVEAGCCCFGSPPPAPSAHPSLSPSGAPSAEWECGLRIADCGLT